MALIAIIVVASLALLGLFWTVALTARSTHKHADRAEPDREARSFARLRASRRSAAAVAVLSMLVGVVLAVVVAPGFWALAAAGFLLLVASLLAALSQAMRPALRPQRVRYDHSWFTNLLGQTSVPHPGPAAQKPSTQGEEDGRQKPKG